MNPEQWLSLKWNGGSTMSDRWLNQSKIIHVDKIAGFLQRKQGWEISLEDNNTDLSSYFRVDKKKVVCYTKFTK